jgi:hypothetical protein
VAGGNQLHGETIMTRESIAFYAIILVIGFAVDCVMPGVGAMFTEASAIMRQIS